MVATITIHQCAWCRDYMINGVKINPDIIDCSEVNSHGICPTCAKGLKEGLRASKPVKSLVETRVCDGSSTIIG